MLACLLACLLAGSLACLLSCLPACLLAQGTGKQSPTSGNKSLNNIAPAAKRARHSRVHGRPVLQVAAFVTLAALVQSAALKRSALN